MKRFFKEQKYAEGTMWAILRFLNYSLLAIFGFVVFSVFLSNFNSEILIIRFTPISILMLFIVSPIISILIIRFRNKKHEFFEWEKAERKRKEGFQMTLYFLTITSNLLSGFLVIVFMNLVSDHMNWRNFVPLVYSIVFFLNSIFSVELHYFTLYKGYLSYHPEEIRKKPEGWDADRKSYYDMGAFRVDNEGNIL